MEFYTENEGRYRLNNTMNAVEVKDVRGVCEPGERPSCAYASLSNGINNTDVYSTSAPPCDVSFPLEYPISDNYTSTLTNANGGNYCSNTNYNTGNDYCNIFDSTKIDGFQMYDNFGLDNTGTSAVFDPPSISTNSTEDLGQTPNCNVSPGHFLQTTPENNPYCQPGSSTASPIASSLLIPQLASTQKNTHEDKMSCAVKINEGKKTARRILKILTPGKKTTTTSVEKLTNSMENSRIAAAELYNQANFQYLPTSYRSWQTSGIQTPTPFCVPQCPPLASRTNPPDSLNNCFSATSSASQNLGANQFQNDMMGNSVHGPTVGPNSSCLLSSNELSAGNNIPDNPASTCTGTNCTGEFFIPNVSLGAARDSTSSSLALYTSTTTTPRTSSVYQNATTPTTTLTSHNFATAPSISNKTTLCPSTTGPALISLSPRASSSLDKRINTTCKNKAVKNTKSATSAIDSAPKISVAHSENAKGKTGTRKGSVLENEGFPVGKPILYSDHLDPLPDESLKLLGSSKEKATDRIICQKCCHSVTGQIGQFPLAQGVSNSRRGKSKAVKALSKNVSGDPDSRIVDQLENEDIQDERTTKCRHIEIVKLEPKNGSHMCFGCQKPVYDRYVLQVKDHGYWHAECLKCSNCQDNLSTQKTCYVKNEQVFCRNDYNILFGLSCVKCSLQFKKEQDWMRVAGQHRYHIACFLCKICKRQLGNNEKYHLVNGTDIYCTNHYRDMVNGENSDGQQPPKKAKRNRTSYTEAQIKFLQERFLRDSNPDGSELEKIANHINLKKRVVQVWFQNNRARLKKSANNNKGSNQENKNPTGVGGPGVMHDPMTIDWDNSMEQSSLDEHTYPSASPPNQLGSGSAHFLDSAYSLSSALNGPMSTPLLCLPTANNSTSGVGHGPSPNGDGSGSGTSTVGTPRDQLSPHFSDLSSAGYQTSDVVGTTGNGEVGMDDITSTNDNNMENNNNNNNNNHNSNSNNARNTNTNNNNNGYSNGEKSDGSTASILSALRSSVMSERFAEDRQRRLDSREHQDQHMRQMLMFPEQSPYPPQFHSSDTPYGSQMNLYGGLYSMYPGYGSLHPIPEDQSPTLNAISEPHSGYLRHRNDSNHHHHQHGSLHTSPGQSFQSHFSNDGGSMFVGPPHDMSHGGSARSPFSHAKGHNGNGDTSPTLNFLQGGHNNGGPNPPPPPPPPPQGHPLPCSYSQGHQGHASTSPQHCDPAGSAYGRSSCGSPPPISRPNGGQYQFLPLSRNGANYFDGDSPS